MLTRMAVSFTEEIYNPFSPRNLGMEVANSLGDPCAICMTRGSSRLPQVGPETLNSLGNLCTVCMARDSPKLPQPGLVGDFYAILYDRDHTRSSPWALKITHIVHL